MLRPLPAVRRIQSAFCCAVLLVAVLLPSACALSAEWRWHGVPRVVAISDVHGAFDAMRRTLRASGVIDEAGQWRGGETHLVITGDLLDRGPESRAAMDLLMRLEGEALRAGGQVHVLLGNHEVMNLVGDLRYVAAGEYAAFASDETAEERAYWRQKFVERATLLNSAEMLAEQFDRAHPRGFFAHRRAFAQDGQYGKWLLNKPQMIVLNDTVFVHGGLSPKIAELGLVGSNAQLRDELVHYLSAVRVLTDAAILLPGDSFYARRKIVEELPPDTVLTPEQQSAVDTLLGSADSSIDAQDGPLWYRGNVGCPALTEVSRLAPVLAALGASRVVIGHTPTANRRVVSRLGGRVIEIDTGMLKTYYGGTGHALVMSGDRLDVIKEDGSPEVVEQDPRLFGQDTRSADAIENVLAHGEVVLGARRTDGSLPAQVTLGDVTIAAVFLPAGSRRSAPDVAAYRLDRLLDLQMVPATVLRTLDGRRGALQAVPLQVVTEEERVAVNAGHSAWCPLPVQWQGMFVFDTLIHNDVRAQQEILYSRESWKLYLVNHGDTFGTGRKPPRYLDGQPVTLTAAWRDALQNLTGEGLQRTLGDVLSKGQIRALLRRRDALLEGD